MGQLWEVSQKLCGHRYKVFQAVSYYTRRGDSKDTINKGSYMVVVHWTPGLKFNRLPVTGPLTHKVSPFPNISKPATTKMSSSNIVLPGELVPAQHVNLKLGPGLLQISSQSPKGKGSAPTIISTRAGTLCHSANKSKWWVESNSRRVSILFHLFRLS